MKPMHALIAAALIVAGCSNPFAADPDPTLEISVASRDYLVRNRPGDTTRVLARHGLDDPKGFAGLEIVIDGDNMPSRTYTAAYLASSPEDPKFRVPDTGFATVTVRIAQAGSIVAEISETWELSQKIQWLIFIHRTPYPPSEGFPGSPFDPRDPECVWFWCFRVWRSYIAEDAANYEGEALWVVLNRYHPDECADVC